MFHAFAYGLRLRSNLPIPGLSASSVPEAVDVDIHLGHAVDDVVDPASFRQHYVSPLIGSSGRPILIISLQESTGLYLWTYAEGTRFVIDADGRSIRGDWPDGLTVADAALNLLGPVLGFVLRLRGITCLHASAVAVGGRAIALVGRPSAGKSTTAAALVGLGHALVSEDVVPMIDHGTHYDVIPGYPAIRLWPKSVDILYGSDTSLPLLTQSRDKRRLDLDEHGSSFHREPLPLAAIYYLRRRTDDDQAPAIEATSSHQALMALVGDSYNNYILSTEMRAREFELLGRLTQTVPFRSVTPHKDPARLPQLCAAILDDFERLGERPTGGGRPAQEKGRPAPAA